MAIWFHDRRAGGSKCPMCNTGTPQKNGYTLRNSNTPVCADCEYEIMDTYKDAGYPGVKAKKPKGYDERRGK